MMKKLNGKNAAKKSVIEVASTGEELKGTKGTEELTSMTGVPKKVRKLKKARELRGIGGTKKPAPTL